MAFRIEVHKVADTHILAGEFPGKSMYDRLRLQIPSVVDPLPLFLDFTDIEVITGSYIRESICKLKQYCRETNLSVYPVVANASEEVIEDLNLILTALNDAIIACNVDDSNRVSNIRVIGVLEEKQRVALDAVAKAKVVDASTLAAKYESREGIGATGWNNRLAGLVAKGVVIEVRKGRGKFYRPILEVD